jgi:hypothetical protein
MLATLLRNRGPLLVALLVIAVALGSYSMGVTVEGAKHARAMAQAQAEAQARTIAMKLAVEGVSDDFERERSALSSRADAADLALGRMRSALFSGSGAPQPASGSDGDARTRKILGDCAAEYRRLAGIADGFRAQLVTLQAYVRASGD